jgi:hypothetical protein
MKVCTGRKFFVDDRFWVVVLYDGTEPEGVQARSARDSVGLL